MRSAKGAEWTEHPWLTKRGFVYEDYASLFGRVVVIIFKILLASVDFRPFISELGSNISAEKRSASLKKLIIDVVSLVYIFVMIFFS